MPAPRLLIRADANSTIGSGHVMRCLALAQEWKARGGDVTFALGDGAGAIAQRLLDEGMEVTRVTSVPGSGEDARETSKLARSFDWLVLDGYGFGAAFQHTVSQAGTPFLVLDDYGHADHYYAALLLNQNISASDASYPSVEPGTQLLMGTRYSMLRTEFRTATYEPPTFPPRRLLVTMGGGDPDNVTGTVIQALNHLDLEEAVVTVLSGGNNVHYDDIQERLSASPFESRLIRNAQDMPGLIAESDFAVSAGGSTCWELALMGRPNLIVSLAVNQNGIAQGLDAAGVSLHAGWFNEVTDESLAEQLAPLLKDSEKLSEMSRRGRDLVDGNGASRVADAMLSYSS